MSSIIIVNLNSGSNKGFAFYTAVASLPNFTAFTTDDLNKIDFASADHIVIAGGDGTVSRLLPYLYNSNAKVSIYPIGTGNDLAKELGMYHFWNEKDFFTAINETLRLDSISLTAWKVSGDDIDSYFINYLSIGFSATVVKEFAQCREKFGVLFNRAHFFWLSLKRFTTKVSTDILINDKHIPTGTSCILFSNIKHILGLGYSNYLSNPSDNLLELIFVKIPFQYSGMILYKLFNLSFFAPTPYESSSYFEITNSSMSDINLNIDGESVTISSKKIKIFNKFQIKFTCNFS